jgi:diguanylate cyclase (GGDEF)-like protein
VLSRELGQESLRNEVARAHRAGHPFTVAFLDADDLKALNDSDGHAAGDEFLRAVADALRQKLRSYDPVVRVGGDEFVCGFADTATDAAVRRVMEVREALAEHHPDRSFSAGLAELQAGETLEQLMQRGDRALYRAKHERVPG